MSSLVSEFIINPVLRQARRFSEASYATQADTARDDSPDRQSQAVDGSEPTDYAPSSAPPISCPESFDAGPLSPPNQPMMTTTTPDNNMSSPMTPTVDDGTPRDHLGFPVGSRRSGQIPEDDGMKALRSRIHSISARELPSSEKARLLHELLLEGYHASRATAHVDDGHPDVSPSVGQKREERTPQGPLEALRFWNGQLGDLDTPESFVLSESDLTRTYAPIRRNKSHSSAQAPGALNDATPSEPVQPSLGCQHYERNVKMQCNTCDKWYPCRLCHDAEEDHRLPRFETRHMLCMLCGTPQKASDVCVTCGELTAQYYCSICKLWENRQSKPIYHCNDCGICRRGLGLGKDYVHCKVSLLPPQPWRYTS